MCHSPDSGNVSLHGGKVQRGEPVIVGPVQGLLLRLQDQPEGRDSRDGLESRFCESATNPKTANCESICELRNQFASRSQKKRNLLWKICLLSKISPPIVL